MEKLPEHIKNEGYTMHSWRIEKRKQARIVKKALKDLRMGCAYTPARDIGVISNTIEKIIDELSIKNWGK